MASLRSLLGRRQADPRLQAQARPMSVQEILNGMTANLQTSGGGVGGAVPLPRDPRWGNVFGPNYPFYPDPLDQARPDGGVDPRFSEYPITWNLQYGEQKPIPFEELRKAARNIDLVRRCIEARKKDIAARDWSFTVSSRAINRQALLTGQPEQDVAAAMNKKYAADIARANAFWEMPGKQQDYDWEQWLFAALEEYLVQDAIVVFPRRTYGQSLFSLDIVAGETIKPLRDQWGGKPSAPYAAFQQVLYGFPRGEYTATAEYDADGKLVVGRGFGKNDMYYIKRHEDVRTPFGMSAVEQALISAKLYLKRQGWMLAEYDEGTMPLTWVEAATGSGDIEMDAAQRRMWEDALNDELSGNTAARHRLKVLPPGMKAVETSSADERYKPDYDLFLLKMLAMHFDVPISNLGFNEAKGLGSSGFHESQADNYERQATLPDTRWMSRTISRISREQLGLPEEVVHNFLGLDSEDEAAQDAVAENRVRSGRMTLNEDRARQNKPLYSFPEADMPQLMTTRGVVFLAGSSKQVYPGEMLEPMEFSPTQPGQTAQSQAQQQQSGSGGGGASGQSSSPSKPKPAASKPGVTVNIHNHGGSTQAQKSAELTAFRKWAAKRSPTSTATFNFDHLSHEEAPRDVQTDRRARFAFDLEPDDE